MNQINCNNCHKDLSLAKLENYQKEKDLLICVQCYFKEQKKYKNYEIAHFPLFKRSGKIEGSSEAIVI